MKSNKHIFLIGMMGSGKSSIASKLSKQLNIPYIDTDTDLISIFNTDITDIFNTLSESRFRRLESTYFLEHIIQNQCIYATGGGIILKEENRNALSNKGIAVLLDSPLEVLFKHLKKETLKNRPLLKRPVNLGQLQKIWTHRKKHYFECADIVIKTKNKSLKNIALEIINQLGQYNGYTIS